MSIEIRDAEPGDAGAVAAIHNEAISAGGATFRTDPRPLDIVEGIISNGRPFLVATIDGEVAGWASTGPYEEGNPYYDGVGECAVYVASSARGQGLGATLLGALAEATESAGMFKLVAKVFASNEASLRLFKRCGYIEVGTHIRHGRLRNEWKDVVVLEKLIGEASAGSDPTVAYNPKSRRNFGL
ncbi:MAG TPA: GNAT family N-acetyltransferase [Solirubrobacterales bacterium]|nr:GNAT family N-acetyltransferase [Solirubrobacterales bacterium]